MLINTWFLIFIIVLVLLFIGIIINKITDPRKKYSLTTKKFFETNYDSENGFNTIQINTPKLINNFLSQFISNIIQLTNFIITSRTSHENDQNKVTDFEQLYKNIVKKKFLPDKTIYLTTGDPHSRAFYLRNFGIFYIDILNPDIAIDETDYINRLEITINSINFILSLFYEKPLTTTIIPIGMKYYSGMNYMNKPSDSLLGILSALEMLIYPELYDFSNKYEVIQNHAKIKGNAILTRYKKDLKEKLEYMMRDIKIHKKTKLPMLDRDTAYSSALDTRIEKKRFIVSVNTYSIIKKAIKLNIISERELKKHLKLNLEHYKKLILDTFGQNGYIQNSIEKSYFKKKDPAKNIVIDFIHTKNGFWNLDNADEFHLFKNTVDIVLNDKRFSDKENKFLIISIRNPKVKWYHKIATPSYHGRSIWSHFIIEFVYGLLKIYDKTKKEIYINKAVSILNNIKEISIKLGGYPEVLSSQKNKLYKTFIYKSAIANAWISRYKTILNMAENNKEL